LVLLLLLLLFANRPKIHLDLQTFIGVSEQSSEWPIELSKGELDFDDNGFIKISLLGIFLK